MKVLVIGGGGREHAIIQELNKDDRIEKIYATPGNAGMTEAECINIAATDIDKITDFAKENDIDFAVVTPDDPLALGAVDKLEEVGIPSFGPNKLAAEIESSKSFAKDLMKKYNIPTAKYETFDDINKALEYIEEAELPIVLKADGLALGKGVIIANTKEEAITNLREMMEEKKFGDAGNKVVIEEFLEGPEVSVLSFTDGKTIIPMISSMDHKRAFDNDEGLNTGGMGTVAPNPYYTDEVSKEAMEKIFEPTIKAMSEEGRPFKGCLYFGLMITKDGPKVIEYNCRFGDPETQVVLPLLDSNLLDIFLAVRNEELDKTEVNFTDDSSCCVVLASEGYPVKYDSGFEITLPEVNENEKIYIAGAKTGENGELLSNGGRVLGAVAVAKDLKSAISNAYNLAENINFENAFYRKDIGKKALKALEEN